MNSSISKAPALVLVSLLLTLSGAAQATNGYFTHGVGTESKGMAGTGIGSNAARGPIVSASNPALSVFADDRWEVGVGFFSPMRSYEASPSLANGAIFDGVPSFTVGAGKFDSSSEFFPIPYVAKNWRLNSGNVISTVFYGRGGMNTDWENSDATASSLACDPSGMAPATGPGPFCSGPAGVDFSQAFLMVSYAGKISDRFAFGLGPVFAVQSFEATGVSSFAGFTNTFADCFILQAPGSCDPIPKSLANNGHDISTGFGFAGGIWFAITDAVSAGLAYQFEMSMSEFDDYSDLFAQNGGFDIPASAKLGLSFKGLNDVRLNLDVEHTQYSEIDSVGNSLVNITACPTAGLGLADFESCLGGERGAGFGWEDMTTIKIGVEVTANETTTWRMGYSYGEQPIQSADVLFNILAPGVMEQHFTVGMTKRRANGGAWNFSLMYAPSKEVEGLNLFDPTQTIKLEMKQLEFEISYLW